MIGKTVSVVDAAMASCDKAAYVRSAVESIVKLVEVLLNVPTCGHANNSNLLDDSDRIRDVSPTRLMEQVSYLIYLIYIDLTCTLLTPHFYKTST